MAIVYQHVGEKINVCRPKCQIIHYVRFMILSEEESIYA